MTLKNALVSAAGNAAENAYIEDVFSTYLYAGSGSTQTITNGIDLAGEGGLVWLKARTNGWDNYLFDTERGAEYWLSSNQSSASSYTSGTLTAFNQNGFSLGGQGWVDASGYNYASWTFRKAPKFFDVVTWSGNSTAGREIAHNLGSTPGFIIVKNLSYSANWCCWHRGCSPGYYLQLNLSDQETNYASQNIFGNGSTYVDPTDTVFTVGPGTAVNQSGFNYVAYLFAHDAGGFGDDGTENVISCGSFTADSSGNATVNLGYEPQFVIIKSSSNTSNWWMLDVMRGQPVGANGNAVYANLNNAEGASSYIASPTATGLSLTGWIPNYTYMYIAIRRGPMKTPTSGTEVFSPVTYTGNGTNETRVITAGFPVDTAFSLMSSAIADKASWDRLRGDGLMLTTNTTAAESNQGNTGAQFDNNSGLIVGSRIELNFNGFAYVLYSLRRAPGFFDVVCYTGDGTLTPIAHNLSVSPELVIVKRRSSANGWYVSQYLSSPSYGQLQTSDAFVSQGSAYPVTSTTFVPVANTTGQTFVAYLFATVPGVSKVGSYTGTGTTSQIDCGFSSGARFVLIKRTDSTGDWYVWDSARGIVAGNDPYLLLNSADAEVTGTDYVDTYSAGFELTSTAPAGLNANGGSYIFLAIA